MNKIIIIILSIIFLPTAVHGESLWDKLTIYSYEDYKKLKQKGIETDGMYYSEETILSYGEEMSYWMRLYRGTTYIFYTVSIRNPLQVYFKEGFGNKRVLYRSRNKYYHKTQFTVNKTGVYYFVCKNNMRTPVMFKISFDYVIHSDKSNVHDYGMEYINYRNSR